MIPLLFSALAREDFDATHIAPPGGDPDSHVCYDAKVLLGTKIQNQIDQDIRVVGYTVDQINYWVATDRFDLTAEQIAFIYKLQWTIESFFSWWKRHLNVYHLVAAHTDC